MNVKLLTEYHLEFLCLKEGCSCSSESTLVKIPHCWKSHVAAHIMLSNGLQAKTSEYEKEMPRSKTTDQPIFTFSKLSFNESLDFCNRS